jgi:outer membrane lipoprotein-sorting protein
MLVQAGHVLPTRMAVENSSRDTRTIVVFRNLVVNPKIDPKLFSVATLDQNRRLPGESR